MICKICQRPDAIIEQSEDSNYKKVRCIHCGWWCWLKNYNK